MARTLLLAAASVASVALLAGCMSTGYSYRQDRGDYYYGNPGTDYRYHGSPYYYGDRYYYGYSGHYYPGYYRYPYRYYDYRYPRPPVVVVPRPDGNDHDHGDGGDHDRNEGKAPWRDIGRYQRERLERGTPVTPQRRAQSAASPRPTATPRPSTPPPRANSSSGSRMQQIMRRARDGAARSEREVER